MERNAGMIVRVLKRLKAAVGYQELGMTQHALRCLDSLASLGKIGPLELVVEILRDAFMKSPENPVSAAKTLETMACTLPTPAKHAIELTLAACYGQNCDSAWAANNKVSTRGVKPEIQPKPAH